MIDRVERGEIAMRKRGMGSRRVLWFGLLWLLLQPSVALPQPAQRPLPPPAMSPTAPNAPPPAGFELRPESSRPGGEPTPPRPEAQPGRPEAVPPAATSSPAGARPESPRPAALSTEGPGQRPTQAPLAQTDKVARLLVSIRTDKGIYRSGEPVKLIGKVVNLTGDAPVSSVVDLRVFRKLKLDPKETSTGPGATVAAPTEVVYRTLIDPKAADFSDDGYVIQFPTHEVLWLTKQIEFEARADATPRGPGEGSLAVASFTAEEIGYLYLFALVGLFVVVILYALVLIYFVFMREPKKSTGRNMLLAVYGSGLFFLVVALGGPLLISVSPSTEVLLRTTPVGVVKATTEKIKDLQWAINIGGVVGSDSTLKGGYATPLFILVLAVVGGVISMLLKLPEFLHDYDAIIVGSAEERTGVSSLRAKVFKYFVYIITGPFLGMIVYSLVTLADYTNALALSIMAFSVGFVSDRIVETMLAVAENILNRAKGLFKGAAAE